RDFHVTGVQTCALPIFVYIRPNDAMQVGERYTITRDPYLLKSRKSDRLGYSYLVLGEVQVIGVRDGLFIANITSGRDFASRGSSSEERRVGEERRAPVA